MAEPPLFGAVHVKFSDPEVELVAEMLVPSSVCNTSSGAGLPSFSALALAAPLQLSKPLPAAQASTARNQARRADEGAASAPSGKIDGCLERIADTDAGAPARE